MPAPAISLCAAAPVGRRARSWAETVASVPAPSVREAHAAYHARVAKETASPRTARVAAETASPSTVWGAPPDQEATSRASPRSRSAGPGVGTLLDAGEQVVGMVGEEVLGSVVGDDELLASISRLERIERMVYAEKVRRIGELTSREVHLDRNARTVQDLLAVELQIVKAEAYRLTSTAEALRALPATAEMLRSGAIGAAEATLAAAKLAQLRRAEAAAAAERDLDRSDDDTDEGDGPAGPDDDPEGADGPRPPGPGEEDGAGLLDAIVSGHQGDRNRLRDRIDAGLGAERLGRRDGTAFDDRYLRLRASDDGSVRGRFALDPAAAAHLIAAVESLARRAGEHDPRTSGQRRADALTHLAIRALDEGGLPTVAAQRPHALITVPHTTIEALLADREPPADAPSPDLDGYGAVSHATAAMLLCDADLTAIVTGERQDVLWVGRTRRAPTKAQRAAVIARDRRCVGCGAPAARCQVHHIRWVSRNGPTDIDNLVLVCWSCHAHIHHHGWLVTRIEDGSYMAAPPLSPRHRRRTA
jgi:hypothetical protein